MPGHETKSDFKWPITVERVIATPANDVWNAISLAGNLDLCHPFCASNPVQTWPGADSRDEIHYLSGSVYERRFSQWLEGTGYDLEILHRGKTLASVTWRISTIDERNCALRITVYPNALNKYPAGIRWLPHFLYLRPKLRSYLASVIKGFEWYVTRGEPVPRNQFGTHPWFSAGSPTAR